MLKEFTLQLDEASPVDSFDVLNLDNIGGGHAIAITVRDSVGASLLFAWLGLCQGRATCRKLEPLAYVTECRV